MHIAIIGNGISGVTAARHIRKESDAQISIISAETDYFFSRTALMYIYMGHMTFKHTQPYEPFFWEKNKLDLVKGCVKKVDFDNKVLHFDDGNRLGYDKLVIACGSKPNKFGWPGQDLKGVSGLYSYHDLQTMEQCSEGLKSAVIVGGGLIGVEMAEMFHSRNIPVTFLVREQSFWRGVLPEGESAMINRHIRENHIDLRLGAELKEILADENGRAKAVITSTGEEIPCGFVGLTAGVSPNVAFLKESALKLDRGVLVNQYFETNLSDVYAIGDCAQFHEPLEGLRPNRNMEQVWYTGRMHGETLAKTLTGKKTPYTPGIWFNSAKFFDIEYQTYGMVRADNLEGQKSLYWEHKDGKKAVHIVYEEASRIVKGFNLMGIRFRHEVCDQWLRNKQTIEYVLENLQEANFDPEFFKTYEKEIVAQFERENPSVKINLKRKKRFLEFLGI